MKGLATRDYSAPATLPDMASKGPVELYDPRKYLETLYCSIRMPNEPPQLLETMLKKYQDYFAKSRRAEYLGLCIITLHVLL